MKKLGIGMMVGLFFVIAVTACGNGAGSGLTSQPLSPGDKPAIEQPTAYAAANAGMVGFKIVFVDPEDIISVSVGSPAPAVSLGGAIVSGGVSGGGGGAAGGGVNYLYEFSKRVANVGVSFFDAGSGEWKYSFVVPVVNGTAIFHEGIAPGKYRSEIGANAAQGGITFFSGGATFEVLAGKDNFVEVSLWPLPVIHSYIRVNGLSADFDQYMPYLEVKTSVSTASGAEWSPNAYSSGYVSSGLPYIWVELPLYPDPAAKLEYVFQDKAGKIFRQSVQFDILDFIDEMISGNGLKEIVYQSDTSLTIDVKFQDTVDSYTVELDSSSPGVRALAAGTSGNQMTVLKFKTEGEPKEVCRFPLALSNPNSSTNDLGSVYIYDGPNLIGQGFIGFSNVQGGTENAQTTFFLNSCFRLMPGVDKLIKVEADIAPIDPVNTMATSGHAVAVDFVGSNDPTKNIAVGLYSGTQITTNSPSTKSAPAYIYRSVPRVTALPLSRTTLSNGAMELYRLMVEVDARGDIDQHKLTFDISTGGGVQVNDLWLWDVTDTLEIGLYSGSGPAGREAINDHSDVVIYPSRTVAAATHRIFELRGIISGATSGAFVTTVPLGDEMVSSNMTADAANRADHNFIWSDFSDANHTSEGGGSDWHNGGAIVGFPLPAATLSR